jgi:hypothetical protein
MLRYKGETFTLKDADGKPYEVRQATRQGTLRAYNAGETVWLLPCLMTIGNPWQTPMPTSKKEVESSAWYNGSSFEDIVNEFKYYNCDNERGRYPIFFIPVAKKAK